MTAQAARFCTACGTPLDESARFCTSCGSERVGVTPTEPAADTGSHAPSASSAVRTAQTAAAYAGMASALPWQTVVAGQRPDIGAFLGRAGIPTATSIATRIVHRSVRKPALALLFTTLIDVIVTMISGQPAALSGLAMRFVAGSGTGFLGLLVGKRGGFGRTLVGVGSIATALLQLWNAGSILLGAFGADAGLLSLLPSLISTVSVIVVAVKTILMSFRKRSS